MSSSADEPFDEVLLSAYLDQELEPSERLKVERELDKSPELRTLFAELSQIRNLVAACNIPLESESKIISGPWESNNSTTIVSPTTLDSSHSAWTKNWPRLASLAAAITLLLGLGSIVILSTSTGRWISYQSTNEVARPELEPSPTQSASAPSASARSLPAARVPEAIAPAAGSMKTEAADVAAADVSRFSSESTNESLVARFILYVNSEANKRQLNTGNEKSPANDHQELSGVFRVQANVPSETENGYLLFFDDAKSGKAETLAFSSPSDTLERQLAEIRDKSNQEVSENRGAVGLQGKGQSGVKEQAVELIIPEENWDAASALLIEKGFAMEHTRSNSVDAPSPEILRFRAAANPLSPSGWTIVPMNHSSLGKQDTNSALIAEPARNVGTEASRPASRRSDLDVAQLKESGIKFRRIRVTLSEESRKSRSNE
jgi:anti-sigma factor RsiW